MANIKGSVGRGGVNRHEDVLAVQKLLNRHVESLGLPRLEEDGCIGDNTIGAIRKYQKLVMRLSAADGRIDVGGRTWKALSAGTAIETATSPSGAGTLSGAAWWHANQASFPNSNRLADLKPPFRDKAKHFIDALQAAGATVSVTSTLRHPIRAYLMHYSWKVGKGLVAAGTVPPKPGCKIVWDHGDPGASKRAAREMMNLFGMAHIAALKGLHIDGHAIDMNISWNGTLEIEDADGRVHRLGAPRNGRENRDLRTVGASYGVHKLATDPPHWSINGH